MVVYNNSGYHHQSFRDPQKHSIDTIKEEEPMTTDAFAITYDNKAAVKKYMKDLMRQLRIASPEVYRNMTSKDHPSLHQNNKKDKIVQATTSVKTENNEQQQPTKQLVMLQQEREYQTNTKGKSMNKHKTDTKLQSIHNLALITFPSHRPSEGVAEVSLC
mmetsp:Transcript_6799/g.10754  ORF Transcript_6799/g.10754 Transcript_6799/m.10754 type:complete len:160 (-) Transcript_6799:878-1357(-)